MWLCPCTKCIYHSSILLFLEETSQLIDESLEQTYNDSEVASPIPEYSPEEERKDLEQGRAAASGGDQVS